MTTTTFLNIILWFETTVTVIVGILLWKKFSKDAAEKLLAAFSICLGLTICLLNAALCGSAGNFSNCLNPGGWSDHLACSGYLSVLMLWLIGQIVILSMFGLIISLKRRFFQRESH